MILYIKVSACFHGDKLSLSGRVFHIMYPVITHDLNQPSIHYTLQQLLYYASYFSNSLDIFMNALSLPCFIYQYSQIPVKVYVEIRNSVGKYAVLNTHCLCSYYHVNF